VVYLEEVVVLVLHPFQVQELLAVLPFLVVLLVVVVLVLA
jgi:hypothetical protein